MAKKPWNWRRALERQKLRQAMLTPDAKMAAVENAKPSSSPGTLEDRIASVLAKLDLLLPKLEALLAELNELNVPTDDRAKPEPAGCRYIYGEPRFGDWRFCGLAQVQGSSYCAKHRDSVHQPASVKVGSPP